jgi:hypothetical protein
MPLRAEIRQHYGAAHRRLRAELIRQLGNHCLKCKKEHPHINLAHLTHDPTDRNRVTLLCPSCHAKFDAKQRHAMTRRTWARKRGQLWLSVGIEWAPYAMWEIPEPVRDQATQMAMFQ